MKLTKFMRLTFLSSLVAFALLSLGSVPKAQLTGTALTASEVQANLSFQTGWKSVGEIAERRTTTWQIAASNSECTKRVMKACRKCANLPGYEDCMASMGITSASGLCYRCGF